MSYALAFEPLAPWWVVGLAIAVALGLMLLGALQRARGTWWRALATALLLAALLNPVAVQTERERIKDVAVVVADTSESQAIGERSKQTADAIAKLKEQLAGDASLELRVVDSGKASTEGTTLIDAVKRALADTPPDRVAGVVLVTDGEVHDTAAAKDLPQVPVHTLLTGKPGEKDRRLVLVEGPRFALIDTPMELAIRVEDQGAGDEAKGRIADVTVRIDGTEAAKVRARVGELERIEIKLPHAGENVIEIEAAAGPDELTLLNNRAVVVTNGVRDRLRVLLVSGEPHSGERTWRNLLKADPSVDLVHFTILRPPEKQDGTPIEELSLIAFPTRELFEEKIGEFDLIILDRYQRLGVLPPDYYENIARYVENGGALLVASGPDYASPFTIYDSALGDIMPAAPAGTVTERAYRPHVTAAGERHPVTAGLPGSNKGDEDATWGRWMRIADTYPLKGEIVMEGPDKKPLLMLNRVGKGRVALLLSDHAWLWARGYDGGGPQAELLRRLAHWLMKEPDLEEEKLTAEITAGKLKITRRAMGDTAGPVTVTRPDGSTETVPLSETSPGRFEAMLPADSVGLYRVKDGDLTAVAASGALNPREFQDVRATEDLMKPVADSSGGTVSWLEDGVPSTRRVREGRSAGGAGWIGLVDRQNYATLSVSRTPLLDPLIAVILALGLWVLAWRREGR
ncbi:hypothetical protein sos41_16820 [Alphaproteobacteria bacterium SO-S41]|nr:hypothetical protein sos41_16820 [Alphaproteobacteria bacterium SO-S41]